MDTPRQAVLLATSIPRSSRSARISVRSVPSSGNTHSMNRTLSSGTVARAASGALSDLGINDGFLRELGETLPKASAALCLLVRDATPDRVVERLRSFAPHAKLLRTSLSHTDEAQLSELLENSRKQAEALRLG